MRDRKLDRLFDRFRTRGDVRALGQVFDHTAPELLRVAMSLVRDPGEADDLLQATYLTAIERAERYDSDRRLVPWLLGILVVHAHELRRTRARGLDEERIVSARGDQPGPAEHAEAEELSAALLEALAGLSELYRGVLEPFLREGKRPAEISRDIGVPPGTVRMRIHRGLDLLRQALPTGLALGAALTIVGGRGLAAVKVEVLREAAASSLVMAASAGASAALPTLLAGITMTQKSVLAAIGLVLVAGLAWITNSRAAEPRSAADPPTSHVVPEAPTAEAVAVEPPAATPAARREPVAVATSAPTTSAATAFEAALAGVRGRLVESDGSPIPGTRVELLEFRGTSFLTPIDATLTDGPPDLSFEADDDTTDADGVFELRGVRARSFHLLGVDLGGGRPAIRLLDVAFEPGELTDLGDVVLHPAASLTGRLVDVDGAPIGGARVRAADLPGPLSMAGRLRTDSKIYAHAGSYQSIMELPRWISDYEERLPIPTTRTDANGVFRLSGVFAGKLLLIADHPGFDVLARPSLVVEAGQELDTGDLVLPRGKRVVGRVVDALGEPVARAEVVVGRSFAGPAILDPTRTDSEGRFELTGVPVLGELVVAARAGDQDPWTFADSPSTRGENVLVLPAQAPLVVDVLDLDGAPIEGVELYVHHAAAAAESNSISIYAFRRVAAERDAGGIRHRVPDLAAGDYAVYAVARGFGTARAVATTGLAGEPAELVLTRARDLALRVVDGSTGEPVARADVRLVRRGRADSPPAQLITDADGRGMLADVPLDGDERWSARVEHPGYAVSLLTLDVDAEEQELVLLAGGQLEAHLDDGAPDGRPRVLQVNATQEHFPDDMTPRFALFDGDGVARVTHLSPGSYTYRVREQRHAFEPWKLLFDDEADVEAGSFEVLAAETTVVEIGAKGATPGAGTGLTGRVRIDGQEAARHKIIVWSEKENATTTSDTGYFELLDLKPGQGALIVLDPSGRVIMQQSLELVEDELRHVELDLHLGRLLVTVRTANGEPAAQVHVLGSTFGESFYSVGGLTDRSGEVELMTAHDGTYMIRAEQDELGKATASIEVNAGEERELALTLDPGVPCEGEIVVPGRTDFFDSVFVTVFDENDVWVAHHGLEFEGETAPFRLTGMAPGRYKAHVFTRESRPPVWFVLPEGGDRRLRIEVTK